MCTCISWLESTMGCTCSPWLSSYISASIKLNSLRPREPGTSLSCSSISGGLGDSSFPSGSTLKRHFSSRFHADSNNCPIRGIPEEMLKPIEPGWYKGQLRKQTWCWRKAILQQLLSWYKILCAATTFLSWYYKFCIMFTRNTCTL